MTKLMFFFSKADRNSMHQSASKVRSGVEDRADDYDIEFLNYFHLLRSDAIEVNLDIGRIIINLFHEGE
jgi:hypothetical protein